MLHAPLLGQRRVALLPVLVREDLNDGRARGKKQQEHTLEPEHRERFHGFNHEEQQKKQRLGWAGERGGIGPTRVASEIEIEIELENEKKNWNGNGNGKIESATKPVIEIEIDLELEKGTGKKMEIHHTLKKRNRKRNQTRNTNRNRNEIKPRRKQSKH